MKSEDAFAGCHPVVNLVYFAAVLCFSMSLLHPLSLCISLACALAYRRSLGGGVSLRFLLPLLLLAALINPAFNHAGVTILCYLPSGNPLTLESLAYGLAAALMLCAAVLWFSCVNAVLSSDKFIYLFGRVAPALSLLLSMTLRFLPRFRAQMQSVVEAQRSIGRSISEGRGPARLRHALTIFSILLTWALENAIETADSMRSRGYGLPGRSAFSIYRWSERDRLVLACLLALSFFLACGWAAGGFGWSYYPRLRFAALTPWNLALQLAYLALCALPLLLRAWENRLWRRRAASPES